MPVNSISATLDFLRTRLINFGGNNNITVGNVSIVGDEELNGNNFSELYISIINVREERLASNKVFFEKQADPSIDFNKKVNATKYFSISLLFSSCSVNQRYSDAVLRLENVLECFQNQHTYEIPIPGQAEDLRIVLELQNLDLQAQNQLWSILGGKYFPSVLYKVKMIPIFSTIEDDGYGAIERIRFDLANKPKAKDALVIETTNDLST